MPLDCAAQVVVENVSTLLTKDKKNPNIAKLTVSNNACISQQIELIRDLGGGGIHVRVDDNVNMTRNR